MDHSPLDSSVHGVSQARILEWVAIFSSGGSFQPRSPASPALQAYFFYCWAIRESWERLFVQGHSLCYHVMSGDGFCHLLHKHLIFLQVWCCICFNFPLDSHALHEQSQSELKEMSHSWCSYGCVMQFWPRRQIFLCPFHRISVGTKLCSWPQGQPLSFFCTQEHPGRGCIFLIMCLNVYLPSVISVAAYQSPNFVTCNNKYLLSHTVSEVQAPRKGLADGLGSGFLI